MIIFNNEIVLWDLHRQFLHYKNTDIQVSPYNISEELFLVISYFKNKQVDIRNIYRDDKGNFHYSFMKFRDNLYHMKIEIMSDRFVIVLGKEAFTLIRTPVISFQNMLDLLYETAELFHKEMDRSKF